MELLLLNQDEVRGLLDFDDLLAALEEGFRSISDGTAVAARRNQLTIPDAGFLLGMPAWKPGGNFAVKLVTVFHGNAERGLPGHQALVCLFDPETGSPVALLDGTYITACRTAGAAAVSVRLLARREADTLAIVGAGVQGRAHLEIVARVRDFRDIRVVSRRPDQAEALAAAHPKARAVSMPKEAVRAASVVCLCTNAEAPVIEPHWVAAGTHVTSVGYRPPCGELPPPLAERAKLFVETGLAFDPPPVGCGELAGLAPSAGTELGAVLSGWKTGRESDDEVTVYKSMGHAVEDLVAANLVYREAVRQGVGRRVEI